MNRHIGNRDKAQRTGLARGGGSGQDTYFLCKDKDPETHLECKALLNCFYNVMDKVLEEINAQFSDRLSHFMCFGVTEVSEQNSV